MKNYIFNLFVFIAALMLFVSCTTGGAELNLVGKWGVDTFEVILPGVNQVYDTDGYITLRYNDTYEMDMDLKGVTNGEIEDDGIVTSDYSTKKITFYSNNDDYEDLVYTYSLNGSTLVLVNDDFKLECSRISYNY